jgi:hypothetical protein
MVYNGLEAIGVHAMIGGPCGGCQQRREALNTLVPLADETPKES